MPVMDLYDNQIMAMAINAAKDERDKAEDRLETLNKLYGDFYSPSDVDMASWQREVVKPFKDELDRLYGLGIDPTRSAEGRAALARLSRSVPYEDMNKLKQSAQIGQEYEKNKAKLLAENLYDPAFEQFQGRDLKNWDTLKDGVWQYSSPSAAPGLQEATSPWYEKRSTRPVTKEEVEAMGLPYDPKMDYTGYLLSDSLENAAQNLPAFLNTPYGRYQQSLAKQQLEREADADRANGLTPKDITSQDVNKRLVENIAGANYRWLVDPTGTPNKFAFDDYQTANDIRAAAQKAAIDDGYDRIKFYREHPEFSQIGGGQQQLPLNLDTHHMRVEATGIANLFGGKNATLADFASNYQQWGDNMQNIEKQIVVELSPSINTITKNGKKYNTYTGWSVNDWKKRHMTNYAPESFIEFAKRAGGSSAKLNNKAAVILNDQLIGNLYSLGEVMKKNNLSSVRKRASNKYIDDAGDTRENLKIRVNNFGQPYMHSTGKIFTQVGDDNRIHHYAEVYVKYKDVDAKGNTGKALNTKKMYYDMGLESMQNGLSEDPTNYNRNAVTNFYATNPTAESRKAASQAVNN